MGLVIGARVVMTGLGLAMAKERKLLPSAGQVRDVFHAGRRSEQIYVLRDTGGCEWWPTKAWDRRVTAPMADAAREIECDCPLDAIYTPAPGESFKQDHYEFCVRHPRWQAAIMTITRLRAVVEEYKAHLESALSMLDSSAFYGENVHRWGVGVSLSLARAAAETEGTNA